MTYEAYHGTRTPFSAFNYDYIGSHGTDNGFGIYFTNNFDLASSYGDYVYKAKITIHELFSNDSITITKKQVKYYIKTYVDKYGDGYLSFWGDVSYEGYEHLLNKVVNDLFILNNSDNEILSEILPHVSDKYSDKAYNAIYTIFKKDGIIYKGYSHFDGEEVINYIVYSNSQISDKQLIE